jgi:hypothetical protein
MGLSRRMSPRSSSWQRYSGWNMAEQRATGDFQLEGPSGSAPMMFVLTSISWREAWKYHCCARSGPLRDGLVRRPGPISSREKQSITRGSMHLMAPSMTEFATADKRVGLARGAKFEWRILLARRCCRLPSRKKADAAHTSCPEASITLSTADGAYATPSPVRTCARAQVPSPPQKARR